MADNRIVTVARDYELQWWRHAAQLRCAMPGTIVSFNPITQRCVVRPGIKMKHVDGNTVTYVELPTLVNVPCIMPSNKNFAITIPITAGDACLLVFSDRSIDQFLEYGKLFAQLPLPNDHLTTPRQHSLTDAICIPGLITDPAKISNYATDALEFRTADGTQKIKVTSTSASIISGSSSIVAGSSGIAITTSGTFTLNTANVATQAWVTDYISHITSFPPSAHTHPESDIVGLVNDLAGKQAALGYTPENTANRNIANGYAPLDAYAKVPIANLPTSLLTSSSLVVISVGGSTQDAGNYDVPHNLGRAPLFAFPISVIGALGIIQFRNPKWSTEKLFLVASDYGLTGEVILI
jgi:hypothetical protein